MGDGKREMGVWSCEGWERGCFLRADAGRGGEWARDELRGRWDAGGWGVDDLGGRNGCAGGGEAALGLCVRCIGAVVSVSGKVSTVGSTGGGSVADG